MTYRFLIISLASLAIVASCSPAKEATNNKKTYSEQEIVKNHEISWLNLLNQKENNYIVFVYSEKCGHCHDMIDEIVDFASDDILPTYFVDTLKNEIAISTESNIGKNHIDEVKIQGTPSIIEVENARVIADVAGIDNCLTYLNTKRMEIKYIL